MRYDPDCARFMWVHHSYSGSQCTACCFDGFADFLQCKPVPCPKLQSFPVEGLRSSEFISLRLKSWPRPLFVPGQRCSCTWQRTQQEGCRAKEGQESNREGFCMAEVNPCQMTYSVLGPSRQATPSPKSKPTSPASSSATTGSTVPATRVTGKKPSTTKTPEDPIIPSDAVAAWL